MRYWVGITDRDWSERLQRRSPVEVNFWQPNARRLANFLQPGVPFLFKLHAPDNYIVGGGFFVRFSALPARLAWDAFGQGNGVDSYQELRRRIEKYRGATPGDPEIGCNLLAEPFFFDQHEWIPTPPSMHPNTQRGKTYDSEQDDGRALWQQVEQRMKALTVGRSVVDRDHPRFGGEYMTRPRWGQGTFRVLVTEAYERRCAVTGERTLPVLEAAHIKGYAEGGAHLVSNGLLLRADLHKLFDDFYLTVTEDLRLRVSPRIREEFHNGREYYRHDGQPLVALPESPNDRPGWEFLRWHNERFLG
jgi:putative restriction endonuclease